jgi:hypothetical protein
LDRPIFARILNLVWFLFTWFLLVALLCVVLAGIYCYNRVDEEIRKWVEALLARHYTGVVVSVKYARLLEREGFEIGGVSFSERNARVPGQHLAYVDEILVRCRPSWRDLLAGRVQISEIVVRRPVIRATRLPDGTWTLSRLLPERCRHPYPQMRIENGVIEIVGAGRDASSPWTLRNLHATISCDDSASPPVESGRLVRFELSLTGDHVRRCQLEGSLCAETSSWEVNGQVSELKLSPALWQVLPPQAAELVRPLGALEAHCDLVVSARHDAASQPPLQFQIRGQVSDGRLDDPHLSYPVTDLSAELEITPERVRIENIRGRYGSAVIHLACHRAGHTPQSPLTVAGTVDKLTVDRNLVASCPDEIQRCWSAFQPEGSVSAGFQLHIQDGRWIPSADVRLEGVSFQWSKFPYLIEESTGSLAWRDKTISFQVRSANPPCEVRGEIEHPGAKWRGWFEAHTSEPVRIDERLISATDPEAQRMIRDFTPRGAVMMQTRVERTDGMTMPSTRSTFRIVDASIRHVKFPYPLHTVHGRIERFNDRWEFREFTGQNDSSFITCEGSCRPAGDERQLSLRFVGTNVPLEDELRGGLSPAVQHLWNQLQPRGTLDHLTADFDYNKATAETQLVVKLQQWTKSNEALGTSLSIRPRAFPYRIDDVTGSVIFRDGRASFGKLRGRHGQVTATTQGSAALGADGRWRVDFTGLTVDQLRAEPELVSALPPRLAKAIDQLNLEGPVSLAGRITLENQPLPQPGIRASWDLTLDLEDARLNCGVPCEHLCGRVDLRGGADAVNYACQGDLWIDSTVCHGVQLTDVKGPFWLDGQRLLAGRWANPAGSKPAPRPVTASVFGGTVEVDAQRQHSAPGQFDLTARLADGELEELAREVAWHRARARGRTWLDLRLEGNGQGPHTWRGNGTVTLRNTELYELPLVLALLQTLRTGSTDATAFTSSDIKFRFQGEHVYFDQLDLAGDALTLKGVGEMNLKRELNLNFYTVMGREDSYLPAIRPLLGLASRRFLLVNVTGTMDNPVMTREVLPGLNETLQQWFPEPQHERAARATEVAELRIP